jgi:hypothetical protein
MYKPRVFESGLIDSQALVLLTNQQFITAYLSEILSEIAAKQPIRQVKDVGILGYLFCSTDAR